MTEYRCGETLPMEIYIYIYIYIYTHTHTHTHTYRRRKKLLDDLGNRRGYSHLKEEALDRIKWRNRFGRGCGPDRLLMNECTYTYICLYIKIQLLANGNYFNISNCRTKILAIFRDIFIIFCGISK
jgi:hypothetical protein